MTTPIKIERLTKELEKLHAEMIGGAFGHSEYDQRLARVIHELRERGIDGDRAQITAALDDALSRGIITPAVKDHLEKRLGLV
jgi:hypothetical protein